ncbi:MAG TPA: ATP-binding protein [Chthoniobacterales bacterium]|jgi:hypothetical protein
MTKAKEKPGIAPDTIGEQVTKIPVELSTRFLEQFSEQLYSSPQKAFEELISNGWDAGAPGVDVRVSENLSEETATLAVFDNGISMDEKGLRELWHIAFSPKRDKPVQFGRAIIGKFGIGKLATYVLARKLTYICKADDGVIRRVTMDYGEIDKQRGASRDKLISEIELDIFEVQESEVTEALKTVYGGAEIAALIKDGFKGVKKDFGDDEYGGEKSDFKPPKAGTWTLVVLSDLKQTGRDLKIGVLKRMLRAALPFGSEMVIRINGEILTSSKLDAPKIVEWTIGPELGITEVELEAEVSSAADGDVPKEEGDKASKIAITSGKTPVPFVDIPDIGRVTGKVKLFREPISGGKSDMRGASNGFHINVLGRVVNQGNPSFGEKDLSHAAWARFRMTVRADGLNGLLNTNREQFREREELRVFRAFLRKVFNKARTQYDDDASAALVDGGDILVRSLGVLSLNPLRSVVAEALRTKPALPDMFDETGLGDKQAKLTSWTQETAEKISAALGEVKYEKRDDDSFVKFRLADNSIVINKEHPFVLEHSRTKAEKELLRTVAMVDLLSDFYALDIGVDPAALKSIRAYRDRLMRFRAMQNRKSGTYIAKLLLQTQHRSEENKQFEAVLSDALRYLGFEVRDLAQSGEPEGIASAYPTPSGVAPTDEQPNPPLYSFSFDAKSSKHGSAKTGNVKLDGVVEHRKRYKADYALVVGPGFTGDAINTRCEQQEVTPMVASDLGRLLEYTVEFGAIPLKKLQELFSLHNHENVTKWVDELGSWIKKQRPITIAIFIKALEQLKGKVPDVLPAGTIALQCREKLGAKTVQASDVVMLARGLSILVPDLIGVEDDKIIINASAGHVAEAIRAQLEKLQSEEPLDVKEQPSVKDV